MIAADYKLVHDYLCGKWHLFNIAEDPGDLHDVVADEPVVVERLKKELADWQKGLGSLDRAKEIELDEEIKIKLKALGYL